MRRRDWNQTVTLLLADLALIILSLPLASWGRLNLPFGVQLTEPYVSVPAPVFVMGPLVWLLVSTGLLIYTPLRPQTKAMELWALVGALMLSNLALAGLLYITFRDVPRLLFVYSLLLQIISLVGLRLVIYTARLLRRDPAGTTQVLVIGAGRVGQELARRIQEEGDGLVLAGYLDDDPEKLGQELEGARVLGATGRAPELVKALKVDEVILALPLRAHQHLEELILALQAMPVRVSVVPDYFDLAFFRATITDFRGIPLVGLRDPAIDGSRRVVKRLFDLITAGIGVVLAGPLLLLVAIAIKLDSPGPALFRQKRVGENGKLFTIYKFRSMAVDAERAPAAPAAAAGGNPAVHKRRNDPRVTRVGRFIRRTSLDELPQLFNVLKGDMSLVGPRPELPWLVERYESWQHKRLAVPPGMTGWWQVNGRSDRPMHENTADDLYYIQNYSPWLDLRIIWRTIGVVLRGRGAY